MLKRKITEFLLGFMLAIAFFLLANWIFSFFDGGLVWPL